MKTAEEILGEKFGASEEYPLQLCITLNPSKALILDAMYTYCNQQTAELTAQLEKERKDKEEILNLLKDMHIAFYKIDTDVLKSIYDKYTKPTAE